MHCIAKEIRSSKAGSATCPRPGCVWIWEYRPEDRLHAKIIRQEMLAQVYVRWELAESSDS